MIKKENYKKRVRGAGNLLIALLACSRTSLQKPQGVLLKQIY
jgi:hypothetical protein